MKNYHIKLSKTTRSGYFRLNCYEVSYTRFDGNLTAPHNREVLVTKNSIGAILFDDNKKSVVLIEQFRIAPSAHQDIFKPKNRENPWVLEIVAGTIDSDEKVEQTLEREVKEESGLDLISSEYIGSYYLCPGYSSEKMHAFCVEVDLNNYQEFAGLEEENEDIAVKIFHYDELRALCSQVNIFPTLAMIQWFMLNKLKK